MYTIHVHYTCTCTIVYMCIVYMYSVQYTVLVHACYIILSTTAESQIPMMHIERCHFRASIRSQLGGGGDFPFMVEIRILQGES